ncbi:MAG: lysozyme inhibitor LprI family protein [Janthinobacterium lividum]
MRELATVLLAGVVLALPAWGQVDRDAGACASRESTVDIEDCYAALTARWDRALNAAYGAAMKAADPSGTGPLRAAERAWIEFRKQECLYRGAGPGTIGRVVAANCFYAMTRARAEQLVEDAKGLGPG